MRTTALALAAAAAFLASCPPTFAQGDGSSLEIVEAELLDESGDGAFQPGEPGRLRLTLQSLWASPLEDVVVSARDESGVATFFAPASVGNLPGASPGLLVEVELPFETDAGACGVEFEPVVDVDARSVLSRSIPSGVRGRIGAVARRSAATLDEAPLPIPEGGGRLVMRTLDVGGGTLAKMSVGVSIDHPNRGDLLVLFEAPSGESFVLFDGDPSDTATNLAAIFPVPDLVGQPADGVYRLGVVDKGGPGEGFMKGWSLYAEVDQTACEPWSEESPPTLPFEEAPLWRWEFASGDGAFFGDTGAAKTLGLAISASNEPPDSAVPARVGFWTSPPLGQLNIQSGKLYAIRASMSANQAAESGASTRIRVEPVDGASIDHALTITAVGSEPHSVPTTVSKDYLAYARPFDLDDNGQNILAFDVTDDGNSFGRARSVTLHGVQVAASDPMAFLGSPNALLDAAAFELWSYQNYGALTFGGVLIHEGGEPASAPGSVSHLDDNGETGGAAEWIFGEGATADSLEQAPGALRRVAWTVAAEDGGDGMFPRARLSVRTVHPAISAEYLIRGDEPAFAAAGSGNAAVYEQFWVDSQYPNSSGSPGVRDDLALAFGLYNFTPGIPGRDGLLRLSRALVEELAPDDPNVE